jgi:type II secretion system protein N
MNPRLVKIAGWAGYPLFYVAALLLFAYLTFPYDSLRDRITGELNAHPPVEGLRVNIQDLDSYWFSGIEAEGVQLISTQSAVTADAKPVKPRTVTLDQVHARVSLLRLLFGVVHVSFGMDAFGGQISGYTSDADNARTLDAELDGVNVGDLPKIAEIVGLPLSGALSGTIELKAPEGRLAKAEGAIALKISDLTLGDGKAKIMNTIALPTVNAGELVLEGEATDGRLNITKFTATGKDLEVVSDGRIRLRDPFTASLAEMNLRFKFTPAYKGRSDTTKALLGAPGSNVPGVMDLDPKVRRAKRPDEFYAWRLNGPLARLNFEPAAMAGGARQGGAAPSSGFGDD